MRNPKLVVAMLAVLAVSSRARASEEAAAGFVKAILPNLPVQQEPCKQPPKGAGEGTAVLCAHAQADFDAFSHAWDTVSQNPNKVPAVPKPMTDWVTQVGGRMRWFSLGDKWIVVTYDTSGRSVMISYPKDRADVFALARGISPPRRVVVEDASGEARRNARAGLKPDAQGVVVISAVIRKDGTVGDLEVLGCLPRNRGLEQAAESAIRSWRYEPGTKEGAAVNVALLSAFTYGPGGFFRTSDGSDPTGAGGSVGGGGGPKGGPGGL